MSESTHESEYQSRANMRNDLEDAFRMKIVFAKERILREEFQDLNLNCKKRFLPVKARRFLVSWRTSSV